MIGTLAHSVWSEWLKQKRSLTFWLVIGSAFFVPSIIFLSRFRRIAALPALYQSPTFWNTLWVQSWEAMALMILPMAVMLLVSLITQIEYRNNAWKQVHATPQPLATIFAAKLLVILSLVVQLLLWFTIAIYLSGIVPALLFTNVDAPVQAFPRAAFLRRNGEFLIDALPIVALQYLLSLRFRTFLTPLGLGMAMWILSIGTMSWRYNYLVPYSYASLDYLMVEYKRPLSPPASLQAIAAAVFIVFTGAGYAFYARWRDRE